MAAELTSEPAPRAGARVRHAVRSAGRWTFKTLGTRELLLPVVLRITPEGTSRQITDETDIVVEGLPRSGNTFAAFALRRAAEGQIRVSSHVHVPAQVSRAVRRGVPTVVTIREPVEATVSHMAAVPHLSAKRALREYIDYYQRMIPLADHVVVADFDEIVSDFGQVVERVNAHFDVTLEPFEPTQENVDAVSRAMDDHWAQVHAGRGRDSWQPRPTDEKSTRKAVVRREVEAEAMAAPRAEAREVYAALTAVRQQQAARLLARRRAGRHSSESAAPTEPAYLTRGDTHDLDARG